MKRKIYLVLFVAFILLAGLSAYKLINDQVEYHEATDYYQSIADSWVKPNPKSESQSNSSVSSAPAETESLTNQVPPTDQPTAASTDAPPEPTATPSAIKASPEPTMTGSPVDPSNSSKAVAATVVPSETAKPIQPSPETSEPTATISTVASSTTAKPVKTDSKNETPVVTDKAVSSETSVPAESVVLTEVPALAENYIAAETSVPSETPVSSFSADPTETTEPSVAAFSSVFQSDYSVNLFTTEQPPISVDFDELKQINEEVVGWIYCEGTPINYPVMQAKDNEKYLNALPDKRFSLNGSVFIDCDCESDFTSDNTLMYGHNRKTGMFACLPLFKNKNYYQAHSVMWLLTPATNYKVYVFAGFNAHAESWVYEMNFFKEKFRTEYVEQCLQSSDFKPLVEPIPGTRLLTLSTCHYFGTPDGRYVVIGMLIPSVSQ